MCTYPCRRGSRFPADPGDGHRGTRPPFNHPSSPEPLRTPSRTTDAYEPDGRDRETREPETVAQTRAAHHDNPYPDLPDLFAVHSGQGPPVGSTPTKDSLQGERTLCPALSLILSSVKESPLSVTLPTT